MAKEKMRLIDLTLDTPAENLALDEALLLEVEQQPMHGELLRLWESPTPFVVLGRSSQRNREINPEFCLREAVPVLRRCSGGGTVVAGPGCLMYAVVLRYDLHPGLRMLDQAHRWVMGRIRDAVALAGVDCTIEGTCDLALEGRKVGGNALRCLRHALLYHGTLLYGMPGRLIEDCLGTPARIPAWRANRSHSGFVASLPVPAERLKSALVEVWQAEVCEREWPRTAVASLVEEKYSRASWNEHP